MLPAEDIGKRLRSARRERGLSIHELSRRTGVSSGTISDIENAVRPNPRRETIEKLVATLGTDTGFERGVLGGPMWLIQDGLVKLSLSKEAVAHVLGTVRIWQSIEHVEDGGELGGD
ncbi:helix-turn-helix domain-containing protein [Candidatus Parcubacteria bacterium]|nr:helix-turn-helix domain-containing protein [Candidatus Parcubacteria bacterium]